MVNGARAGHGVRPIKLSERISRRAHKHSVKMARSRSLYHSCVACKYRRAAENVGMGRSVKRVHSMLMASSSHRSNILNGSFGRIGVGVVKRGGRVWVTQIFVG
jgi:uncharacterized protein YkwD